MAEITAALVQGTARTAPALGMMDCKKSAGPRTNGDLEAGPLTGCARRVCPQSCQEKADRVAADGLVGVSRCREGQGHGRGAAVEVERRDRLFVARNELFPGRRG